MRKFSNIDNEFCVSQGLNIQQGYVYEWMLSLHTWADKLVIEGKVYLFASKTKACQDLEILTTKTNTMHTHYKALESKGLIEIKKVDNKDYIYLTELSQLWNASNSFEKNQSDLGEKSKESFDKNQTYSNNHIDSNNQDSTLFDVEDLPTKILKYLNEKKPSKIPFTSASGLTPIKARIKEKFTEADLKAVIDLLVVEWDTDKMRQYIRPETIFGTKFNGYLIRAKQSKKDNSSNLFTEHKTTASDLV